MRNEQKKKKENLIMQDSLLFYGCEDEVKGYIRQLDFAGAGEIEAKYNSLIPSYKRIVNQTLAKLLGENDHFGYNLSAILTDYKNADSSVAQRKISNIVSCNVGDDLAFCEDDERNTDEITNINNLINGLKKQSELPMEQTKSHNTILAICDQFFLSEDLFKFGIGKVRTIKAEWLEKFLNDSMVTAIANDLEPNDLSTKAVVELYEKHLRRINHLDKNDTIMEECWAVVKKSGMYQILLNEKSRIDELNAINHLISELYTEQLISGKMPSLLNNM